MLKFTVELRLFGCVDVFVFADVALRDFSFDLLGSSLVPPSSLGFVFDIFLFFWIFVRRLSFLLSHR